MRVAMIGAGVVGLSIAWRLAGDGHQVDVFDDAPGHGASYAAAGMLSPAGEAWFGETELLRLGLASMQQWPGFADQLTRQTGLDVGLSRSGTLLVGVDDADAADLDRVVGLLAAHDVEALPTTRRELRALEPSIGSARRTIRLPGEFSVDNRKLLTALRAGAEHSNARFHHERADVRIADGLAIGAVGRSSGAFVPADITVAAAGFELADVAGLSPEVARAVRPVKGQILRLQGARGILRHTVRALVRGSRVYAVPRPDGEIVIGATQEERDDHTVVTVDGVHRLLDDALTVIPALRDCALAESVARARPGTPDNGPLIGTTDVAQLLVAGGHFRGGVLLAPITAEAVTSLVAGQPLPDGLEPFSPHRIARTPKVAGRQP